MKKLNLRDKSILAGLYLSKFSVDGLRYLGFENFTEAFNAIGLALGTNPASIKNYRDEFDPLFPNERKGWHKRSTRKYCKDIYDVFYKTSLPEFSMLLKQAIYKNSDIDILMEDIEKKEDEYSGTFAKRLITGQAAEQFFQDIFFSIDIFRGYSIEDTTKLGCGFDFKLVAREDKEFLGIEVKGLNEASGNIVMTSKEYTTAGLLKNRYFIFVVKNFKEKPFYDIFQDPIKKLAFSKKSSKVVQICWNASV